LAQASRAVPGAKLPMPGRPTLARSSGKALKIHWNRPSSIKSNSVVYELQRRRERAAYVSIAWTSGTSYEEKDLPEGHYKYRVKIIGNDGNESVFSTASAALAWDADADDDSSDFQDENDPNNDYYADIIFHFEDSGCILKAAAEPGISRNEVYTQKVEQKHTFIVNEVNLQGTLDAARLVASNSGFQAERQVLTLEDRGPPSPLEPKVRPFLFSQENFNKNKEWYLLNGVPYRTGIILEGPPGTGKTSMSKALAGHLNKDIYYMDATETGAQFVKNALRGVPPGSLVIIEEIDRMFDFFERESKKVQKSSNAGPLLNALDGIVGNEDRIVIATTNHINKLDPALIREGRFDLKVHVGYMTDETLRTYIDRMYPNFGESHLYSVKENIAPCLMQKLVFANRENPIPVLDQVAVRNTEFKTTQVNKLLASTTNP